MAWEGVVWRATGPHELTVESDTEMNLGRIRLPTRPQPGQIIEVNGEKYVVIHGGEEFCYVRPR